MKKPAQAFSSAADSELKSELTMTATLNLNAEYRLTRAALVNARVEMTDSIDALYRDWRCRRAKLESRFAVDRAEVADADKWWTHHLAQYRCLIDPRHVAARAKRARKDRGAVHARPHPS
jgi:hypothetical protein